MLAEQMSARDDLEKKLKDAQSQMEADKGSHALELERLEAQRREIEKKSAAELASWKEKFEREALKAEGLLKERDMLNSRVNESTCSIGSYREMEAQLRRKLEELENKLGESENRCQSLNDMLDEKVAEIERKHSALTDMTNQRNLLETKCNDITQERDASLTRCRQMEEHMATLEGRLRSLEAQLQDAEKGKKDEVSQRNQLEAQLQRRCAELQQQMQELEKKYQDDVSRLRSEHERELSESKLSAASLAKASQDQSLREKEEMVKLHQMEKQRMEEDYAKEITRLKREHEAELHGLRDSLSRAGHFGEKMQESEKKLQERVTALEGELEVAWKRLRETDLCLKDVTEKREEEILRYTQRLKEVEDSSQKNVRETREMYERKISILKENVDDLRRRMEAQLAEAVQQWEKKLQAERTEAEQELLNRLEVCHFAHGKQVELLDAMHGEQMQYSFQHGMMCFDQIASFCGNVIKLAVEDAGHSLSDRETFQRLLKDATARCRQREEEVQRLKEQLDGLRGDAKEQCNALLEDIRSQKELIAKLTKENESLEAAGVKLTDDLRRLRDDLAEKEQNLLSSQNSMEELRETLEKVKEKALRERNDSLNAARRAHEKEMATKIGELTAASRVEREDLQRRANEALASLQLKYNNTQEDLRSAKVQVDALTNDFRRCSEDLSRERQNLAAAQSKFSETLESTLRDHAEQMHHLQVKADVSLNELGAQHKMFIDDLLMQQKEERVLHNKTVKELQEAFDDLRHRYEYRESRPEDVEMINRLMQEARKKEQELKKALDDMKMYKLELVNRENNYNKVFGRRPIVAPGAAAGKPH
uniref:WGS project CAEQ00000000 data, annotated contig 2229 n=1 Tax=Trypanosoma congolense (strain IL3000) TaxID=1068625 RepID=F9WCG4_TRYCI|nr:unnamed protein product [Trypanosoma congolense IL3000]